MELIGPVKCKGKVGYLTSAGDFAIPPEFKELGPLSEGLVSFSQGDRIGFLNSTGSVVIPPRFESTEVTPEFRNGLACVSSGAGVGYIDSHGEWIVKPVWSEGWHFLENMALASSRQGYFIIDKEGGIVRKIDVWDIRPFPDWIKDWNCFRCLFSGQQGLTGFFEGCINQFGEIVFPPVHDELTDFFNGVAGFCDGEQAIDAKWGLARFDGEVFRKPQYLQLGCFSEGLASAGQVASASGWIDDLGYIDTNGEWVVPPKFQEAFPFSNGLARVGVGGRFSRFGEVIGRRRYGFSDRNGELVIDAMFSSAKDFAGDFAVVEREGKSAVIDRQGKLIWAEDA